MKILIVDDNPDNLDMLEIVLKSQDHIVHSAINGKEALEKLHTEKYDLIVSDILMPVMDGFQLCRECRKEDELKDICFIFYTATYIDNKDEDFAKSLGAHEFIRKPQEPEILIKIINDVYEKSKTTPLVFEEHSDKEILKLYNERLVSKLEKKNIDLEKEINAHKRTVKDLIISKNKAEEMNRLKSNFLANMSHELRTPMNGIIGFSQILKDDNNLDSVKEIAELIYKSSKRLMETLNSILDLSRLASGEVIPKLSFVNLLQILNEIIVLNRNSARNKQLELKLDTTLDNLSFNCDSRFIWEIMNNLINNAIKFTDNGSISIKVDTTLVNKEKYAVIDIIDTGIGIEESQYNVIFDEFRQVSEGLSRSFEGTGLGLTISKKYVELLGGILKVKSKLNEGSTFTILLPLSGYKGPSVKGNQE
ncbi:MAG: response regulator [Ignavibacteriae bacterium]|nr:response regulator [Ignavibacteriota bacterium]